MKKTAMSLVLVLISSILIGCFVGCASLNQEEGLEILAKAYNNTKDNYNDIYQYSEKIYQKPSQDEEGFVINRKVNVICKVNNKYELEKDQDYAINIHEDKYSESIDLTSKISSKMLAYNDLMIGNTTINGDKKSSVDALFVGSGDGKEGKGYTQKDLKAKDFYDSEFFKPYQLMNKQVILELGSLIENPNQLDFSIEKGGIEKKGQVIDYTFVVKQDYLDSYKAQTGRESLFVGKRAWVQVSYGRVSNIYVYKEEDLGGNMNVDYECYTFVITYVGPKVNMLKYPANEQDKTGYEIKNIFDGQKFIEPVFQDIK